ncbi:MAG TPA: glycosyltransferase [Vulgatibacter sp.]|nr:glycosyltransferase [Vulgatibacter sp.]
MTARVLHVLGRLHPGGGIETWLVELARGVDRDRFAVDFCVLDGTPGGYDDEVRRAGSEIIRIHRAGNRWRFSGAFRAALRARPGYDVVHSHVHYFSGLVLHAARQAGVPCRISHSHNDTRVPDREAILPRKAYNTAMRRLLLANGTLHLAVGSEAATALYGSGWERSGIVKILRCGLDFSRFRGERRRDEGLGIFSLPQDAFVVGSIGRLEPQKNQRFLLQVFAEIALRDPNAHLVVVGEGSRREDLEALAAHLGVSERVRFPGVRKDVPRILDAFDVFLLPSFFEGLPLVALEAQAVGLPSLLSTNVTPELEFSPGLVSRLPLDAGPVEWARRAMALRERRVPKEEALRVAESSAFAIRASLRALQEEYERQLEKLRVARA